MQREGLPWRPISYGRSSTTPFDRARQGGHGSPHDIHGQRSASASHRLPQDAVADSNHRGRKRHRPGYVDNDPYNVDGWMGGGAADTYSGGVANSRQRLSPSRAYAVRHREARGSDEALRGQQQQLQLAVRNEEVNNLVPVGGSEEPVVAHNCGRSVREDSHYEAALLDHHMDRIEQLREVCDIATLGQLVAEALTGSRGTTADAAVGTHTLDSRCVQQGPSLLLEGPAGANASFSVADLRPSDLLISEQRATEGLANLRRPLCRKKLPTAPGAYWPSFFDEDTSRASSSARSAHPHVFSLPPPAPARPSRAPPVSNMSAQYLSSNEGDLGGEERGRSGVEESKEDDGEVVLQLPLPTRGPLPEEVDEVRPATEEDDELTIPGAEGEHLDHEDDEDMARETPLMNVNGVVERILEEEADRHGGELRHHHAAEEEEEDQEAVGQEEHDVQLGDYYYEEDEEGEDEDEEGEDGEYYSHEEELGGREGEADQPIELASSSDEGEELEAQEDEEDDAEAAAAAEEPQQSIAGPARPAVPPHGPPFAPGDAGCPAMAVIDYGHVGDYSDLVAHSDDDGQFDAQRVGMEDDDDYDQDDEYDEDDEEREEGSEGREGQPPVHSQQMRRVSTSQLASEEDGDELLATGALRQQRHVERDGDDDAGTVEDEEDDEEYDGEDEEGEGSGSGEGEEDDYEVDAGKAVALSREVLRHRQTEDVQIAEQLRGQVRGNAGRLGGPVSADVESERSDLDDGMEGDEDEEDDEEEEQDGTHVEEGAGVGHRDEEDGEEGHLYAGLEAGQAERRLPDETGQGDPLNHDFTVRGPDETGRASPLYQDFTERRESKRNSRHADRSGRAMPACGSLDAALGLDALQEQTNEDGEHDGDNTEAEKPSVAVPPSREESDATFVAGHLETKAAVISEAIAGPAPPTSEDMKPSAGGADDAGAIGSTSCATPAVTPPAVAATAVVETIVAGASVGTTSATPALIFPTAAADAVAETIVAGASNAATSATPAVTPPPLAADAVVEATVAQDRSVSNLDVVPEDTGRQHGGKGPEEHGVEVEEVPSALDRVDHEDNHPPATAEGSAYGVSAEAERPPEADRSPELERAQDRDPSSGSANVERCVSGDAGASVSDPEVERSDQDAARHPAPEVQGAGGSSGEEVIRDAEGSAEAVAEEERSEEGPAPEGQSAGSSPPQPEQEGVVEEEKEDERQEQNPDEADTQRSILESAVAAAVAAAQEKGHKEVTVTVETTEEVEVLVAAEQDGGGGRRDDGDGNGDEKMEAEVGEGAAAAADVEMEVGADDEVNDGMSTGDGDALDGADADTMKTSDADDDDMMQMDDTAMS